MSRFSPRAAFRSTGRGALVRGVFFVSLALAGCESLSDFRDTVAQKWAARQPPHVQIFAADARATYAAARQALGPLHFQFERGGAAQGELEALSGIGAPNDPVQGARQVELTVHLAPATGTEGTEVQVWLREIVEEDVKGGSRTSRTPVRTDALYQAFFREVQQALASPGVR